MYSFAFFADFNSIKVRLERNGFQFLRLVYLGFQFHKGTIRTHAAAHYNVIPFDFNSIKVRLEHLSAFAYPSITGFQFHKGTIRTPNSQISDLLVKLFQFHKGTIRTINDVFSTSDTVKFQFHKGTIRTTQWVLAFQMICYFNSIKVRLEQFDAIGMEATPRFQFHKGTIRTQSLSRL